MLSGSQKEARNHYWLCTGVYRERELGGAAKARADLRLLPARGRTQQRIFSLYVENGTDWSYQSKNCVVTSETS